MTRNSFQKGYVSAPIRNRRGTAFIIRYRLRMADGRWRQKAETLYGLSGKKAARAVLEQRIRDASNKPPEVADMTFRDFVEAYWRPFLDRRAVKPSTRHSYESALQLHVLPELGELRLVDVAPLHAESLLQAKLKAGLSPKSVRNILGLVQGIFRWQWTMT
jgi:integrase